MKTLKRQVRTITNIRFSIPAEPLTTDAKLVIAAWAAVVVSAGMCLAIIHGGF